MLRNETHLVGNHPSIFENNTKNQVLYKKVKVNPHEVTWVDCRTNPYVQSKGKNTKETSILILYSVAHWFSLWTSSLLKCPLVLSPNLLLFLRSEVILVDECLANFRRSLSLDHVSNCLAGQIQQALDIQIVCCLQEPEN